MSKVPEQPFIPSMIGMLHDVDTSTTPPASGDVLIAGADKIFRPGSIAVPKPAKDRFTVAAIPATTYTLTAVPVISSLGSSLILSLNGTVLVEGTAYTVNYTTGVVTLTSTPTTGQVLYAEYWTNGATWIVPLTGPGAFDGELGGNDVGASGQFTRSYTGEHDTLLILPVAWATGGNDGSAAVTISDTGGLTWVKLAEVNEDWTGTPDTVGFAVFAARAPSTPTSGTLTVTIPAHASFDAYPLSFAAATAAGNVASGHSTTASVDRAGSTSMTLTLGTAPTPAQGTVVFVVNFPHQTITDDAAYTQVIQTNNPGGGGPYGQVFRFSYSYDISGPTGTATVTNASTSESVAAMITITPDAA